MIDFARTKVRFVAACAACILLASLAKAGTCTVTANSASYTLVYPYSEFPNSAVSLFRPAATNYTWEGDISDSENVENPLGGNVQLNGLQIWKVTYIWSVVWSPSFMGERPPTTITYTLSQRTMASVEVRLSPPPPTSTSSGRLYVDTDGCGTYNLNGPFRVYQVNTSGPGWHNGTDNAGTCSLTPQTGGTAIGTISILDAPSEQESLSVTTTPPHPVALYADTFIDKQWTVSKLNGVSLAPWM